MFANVGWGEMFIVALVALVVLGPERLPEAARWIAQMIRKAKQFASDAQNQLENDFGTDFDEIRKPLAEINQLRGLSPRSLVTKHLLDGDDSLFTGNFDAPATGGAGTPGAAVAGAGAATTGSARSTPEAFRQDSAGRVQGQAAQAGGAAGAAAGAGGAAGYVANYDDAT